MALDLTSLRHAIASLQRSLAVAEALETSGGESAPDALRETVRSGVIHDFEVAYEQSRKFMKRWIEENVGRSAADGVPRRELFRLAAESSLIADVEEWMTHHRARNLSSHVYDLAAAEEVFAGAGRFLPAAQALLEALETRND